MEGGGGGVTRHNTVLSPPVGCFRKCEKQCRDNVSNLDHNFLRERRAGVNYIIA